MNRFVFATKEEMRAAAAGAATEALGQAIASKNQANLILATGASQFERLDRLTATPGIDWSKVGMFHLDEYIGLGPDHPASILQEHDNGSLFLDEPAASQLPAESWCNCPGAPLDLTDGEKSTKMRAVFGSCEDLTRGEP